MLCLSIEFVYTIVSPVTIPEAFAKKIRPRLPLVSKVANGETHIKNRTYKIT